MDAGQRRFLEEHGYIVLPSVLSAAAVAELSALFDAELARVPLERQLSAAGSVYSLKVPPPGPTCSNVLVPHALPPPVAAKIVPGRVQNHHAVLCRAVPHRQTGARHGLPSSLQGVRQSGRDRPIYHRF